MKVQVLHCRHKTTTSLLPSVHRLMQCQLPAITAGCCLTAPESTQHRTTEQQLLQQLLVLNSACVVLLLAPVVLLLAPAAAVPKLRPSRP